MFLTDLEVLSVLSVHEWKTGMQMMEELGGGYDSTLYIVLTRLELSGWVESREHEEPRLPGQISRREYKLTESGMRHRHEVLKKESEEKDLSPGFEPA